MEEEALQLDRQLMERLFSGISLKPCKSWRLGSWNKCGRSEWGAEPKAGKLRGTL